MNKPKIIIVCTQECREQIGNFAKSFISEGTYQIVFGNIVQSLDYKLIDKQSSGFGNKASKFGSKFISRVQSLSVNKTKVYCLKNIDIRMTEEKKNNYIVSKIYFSFLGNRYNIAILNCNLLEPEQQSELNFKTIVSENNLEQLNIDHDIFFCGNINFKFSCNNNSIRSREIFKKKYLNKSRNMFNMALPSQNYKDKFFSSLANSIKELGRYLTSGYITGQYKEEIKLYKRFYKANLGKAESSERFNEANPGKAESSERFNEANPGKAESSERFIATLGNNLEGLDTKSKKAKNSERFIATLGNNLEGLDAKNKKATNSKRFIATL